MISIMKKLMFVCIAILCVPFIAVGQNLDNIDFISPFNDGICSIKKGNAWAFIDAQGSFIIDFREDLVPTKIGEDYYPIFRDNRCLVSQKIDGIAYFGYIDKLGKTVIKPEFLNATNFDDGLAIVLKLNKEKLGENEVLGKPVVSYSYTEVIINPKGEIIEYLTDPIHISLTAKNFRTPPLITSKLISGNLVSVVDKNNKMSIKRIYSQQSY